jgi:HAD superfamily hydrolase (TIGR01549 family)
LKQNQKLNADTFRIIEKAIWEKSGEAVTFNLLDNPILSTIHLRNGQKPKKKKTVDTITIDDIAKEAFKKTPSASNIVIKLDVQDAELEALAGASETLKKKNALVIYEDARSSPESETTASVLKNGFHVYYVDPEWKVRQIHSAGELTAIKQPPRNGYNFLACSPGTDFDKKMQGFCQEPPSHDTPPKRNAIPKIKAALFDWDLTLADGEKLSLKALNATFAKMKENLKVNTETAPENWDRATMRKEFAATTVPQFFHEVYKAFGEDVVQQAIDLFDRYRADHRDEVTLLPGARTLLKILIRKGVKIGIVSNKDDKELNILKQILLPEDEFPGIAVVGNKDGVPGKPSPVPIHTALKKLRLRRDQASSVLFVGDQLESDMAAAMNSGCLPCLVGLAGQDNKSALFSSMGVVDRGDGNYAIVKDEHTDKKLLYIEKLSALSDILIDQERQRSL